MAEAIHAAALVALPESRLIAAQDAEPADFLQAKGFIFVCPENLGSMSGQMKEMFDRCYYPLLGQVEGYPFATAIAAGSDGHGAQAQIDRIVTGWRLKRVAEPLIVNLGVQTAKAILTPKNLTDVQLEPCCDLGGAFGEGLSLGIF